METLYYNNNLKARNRLMKGLKFMALAAVAVTGMQVASSNSDILAQSEDLVGFNNANAKLAHINGRYKIVDGNHWMMDFGSNKAEASQALKVLKYYKINQMGYVGRPGPSMTYLLSNGKAPVGKMPGEDAIAFNPQTLKLALINGRYKLVDGNHWVMDFGNKKSEAYKSLQIIKKYGFNRICYVGRPGPSLTYFRVEKPKFSKPVTVNPGVIKVPNKPYKPGVIKVPNKPVDNGNVAKPEPKPKPNLADLFKKPKTPKQPDWNKVPVEPEDNGNVAKPEPKPKYPGIVILPQKPKTPDLVIKPGNTDPKPNYPFFDPNEDLVKFNHSSVQLVQKYGRWKIVDGNHQMMDFGSDFESALKMFGVIKYYKANSRGFVGRPGPSMTYFLVDGKAPVGSMPGEDAVAFAPNSLVVKKINGSWKLMAGPRILMSFGSAHGEALKTKYLINKHGFHTICYIDRNDTSKAYFRK